MDAREYLRRVQVVIICGGPGERLAHITGPGIPKALLKIGNRTLLDRCISLFKQAGCQNFIFLAGHRGELIEEHVSTILDSSRFQIEERRLGKGGAIKSALDSGLISRSVPCLTTFPDDLILDGEFPFKFVESHLKGIEHGCSSTVAAVKGTEYPYGWIVSNEVGVVERFEEKPMIPYPASVGIFVHEPKSYSYFDQLIDLEKAPVDFEDVVLPRLVEDRLLFVHHMEYEDWIPVNDEKGYRRAVEALAKE